MMNESDKRNEAEQEKEENCGKCMRLFKDGHLPVECGRCSKWWHLHCTNLSLDVFQFCGYKRRCRSLDLAEGTMPACQAKSQVDEVGDTSVGTSPPPLQKKILPTLQLPISPSILACPTFLTVKSPVGLLMFLHLGLLLLNLAQAMLLKAAMLCSRL